MSISEIVEDSQVTQPRTQKSLPTCKITLALNQSARVLNESRIEFVDGKQHRARGGYGEVAHAILHAVENCFHPVDGSGLVPVPDNCQDVAVKILLISGGVSADIMEKKFAREVYVWSQLRHENILEMLGHFFRKEDRHFCLVCPWVSDGNALEYLKAHNPELIDRIRMAADTAKGLHYLHTRIPPICHGDIKAVNVLINGGRAQLCDFGLARVIEEGGSSSGSDFKGSVRWCSPELLQGITRTIESDLWAWGWLVWEIITGRLPFHDASHSAHIMFCIISLRLPDISALPQISQLLMTGCWKAKRSDRLAMSDAIVLLQQAIDDAQHAHTPKAPSSLSIASDVQIAKKSPHSSLAGNSIPKTPQETTKSGVTTTPTVSTLASHQPLRKGGVWRAIRNFLFRCSCFSCRSFPEVLEEVGAIQDTPMAPSGGPDRDGDQGTTHANTPRNSGVPHCGPVEQHAPFVASPIESPGAVAVKSGIQEIEKASPKSPWSEILSDPLSVHDLVDITPIPGIATLFRGVGGATRKLVAIKVSRDLKRAMDIIRRGGVEEGRDAKLLILFQRHVSHAHSLVDPHINPTDGHIVVGGCLGVVSPWCENGNIRDYMKRNALADPWELLHQTLKALTYLHGQHPPVIHGCLKPENVLIDADGRVLLSEVGELPFLEKIVRGITTCSPVDDVRWAPPEVLRGVGWCMQSDVYAVGLLGQSLISETDPFSQLGTHAAIIRAIGTGDSPFDVSRVSVAQRQGWKLLDQCLSIEPSSRSSMLVLSSQFEACRAASDLHRVAAHASIDTEKAHGASDASTLQPLEPPKQNSSLIPALQLDVVAGVEFPRDPEASGAVKIVKTAMGDTRRPNEVDADTPRSRRVSGRLQTQSFPDGEVFYGSWSLNGSALRALPGPNGDRRHPSARARSNSAPPLTHVSTARARARNTLQLHKPIPTSTSYPNGGVTGHRPRSLDVPKADFRPTPVRPNDTEYPQELQEPSLRSPSQLFDGIQKGLFATLKPKVDSSTPIEPKHSMPLSEVTKDSFPLTEEVDYIEINLPAYAFRAPSPPAYSPVEWSQPSARNQSSGSISDSNGPRSRPNDSRSDSVSQGFKVKLDDPCSKVLPIALKKYRITTDDWWMYVMFICYETTERCLSLDEKPLLLFKKLKDSGKTPVFMLRHVRDIPAPITAALGKQAESRRDDGPSGTTDATVLARKINHVESAAHKRLTLYDPNNTDGIDRPQTATEDSALSSEPIRVTENRLGHDDAIISWSGMAYAIAIYPYGAEYDDEFDVTVDEMFVVLRRSKGWWQVQRDPSGSGTVNASARTAWVPSGCLLETSVPPATAITEATVRASTQLVSPPTQSFAAPVKNVISDAPILPSTIISTSYPGVALMDRPPQCDHELDLIKDEMLRIFKRFNHWSYVVKESGRRGWVPSWLVGKVTNKSFNSPTSGSALAIYDSNYEGNA